MIGNTSKLTSSIYAVSFYGGGFISFKIRLSGGSGGEETGENAQLLVPPARGFTARLHEKKRNPRPKSSIQDVSQRWTLKACFPFFHCASVGVPKIFAYFSCFLYELSGLKRAFKAL
ncbi:hypothetical protein BP422_02595 [Brevibacillus formosus]|uniref:Uncharacterized protein n=1 Tax=Brevibacillus formosus TaxID=54913 RepID=A0A220MCZ3_9BACL|nr:hypothetical protein BP422_02595 [Brevibacillus formosus]